MQRSLLSLLAVCCLFASCNNSGSASASSSTDSTAQKNLAASRVIANAFTSGDVKALDSVVAPDVMDHSGGEKGTGARGIDSLKAMIAMVHQSNKDMKMETVAEAANGDYVFSWMRYSGTGNGSMGMPAGPYNMASVEVSRFKDGKAVEHWTFMDPQEMMKMMLQPSSATKDTTAKK